jgi:hypothetical protein
MEPHDIDRIERPVPARAPGRRWGALLGTLGVVSLIALTLSASVAGAASPSPAPVDTATTVIVGGAVQAGSAGVAGSAVTPVEVEKMEAAFKEHASCMREHGIDVPDPVKIEASASLDATTPAVPAAGVLKVTGTAQALAFDPASKEFAAADAACASILEDAGILSGTGVIVGPLEGSAGLSTSTGAAAGVVVAGGGDLADLSTSMQSYAACMRTHGVDVPDPVVDEKAGTVQLQFAADPTSAAFREADAACASESGPGFGIAVPAPAGH